MKKELERLFFAFIWVALFFLVWAAYRGSRPTVCPHTCAYADKQEKDFQQFPYSGGNPGNNGCGINIYIHGQNPLVMCSETHIISQDLATTR